MFLIPFMDQKGEQFCLCLYIFRPVAGKNQFFLLDTVVFILGVCFYYSVFQHGLIIECGKFTI